MGCSYSEWIQNSIERFWQYLCGVVRSFRIVRITSNLWISRNPFWISGIHWMTICITDYALLPCTFVIINRKQTLTYLFLFFLPGFTSLGSVSIDLLGRKFWKSPIKIMIFISKFVQPNLNSSSRRCTSVWPHIGLARSCGNRPSNITHFSAWWPRKSLNQRFFRRSARNFAIRAVQCIRLNMPHSTVPHRILKEA